MGGEDPAVARAAAMAALGHRTRLPAGAADEVETAAVDDPDPRVRAAALGAVVRAGGARRAARAWPRAIADADPAVRRRAAELAPTLASRGTSAAATALLALLADDDVTVVVAAAGSLGELGAGACNEEAVAALVSTAGEHGDLLAREAAIAALGALGDPAGLPAILAGCRDKPAVRRRAVLALAPFDGPDVDAALTAALDDRDWQVRQAAEDLTRAD